MKNSITIIPARSGSKGVIGKNSQVIQSVPLALRSLTHARTLTREGGIICVSSDDRKIWDLFLGYLKVESILWQDLKVGEIVRFNDIWFHKRSLELSYDKSLIISLLESLRNSFLQENFNFNSWCLLQPTTPFRSISELELISRLIQKSGPNESIISVTQVHDFHPARMYSVRGNHAIPLPGYEEYYYSRRQDLPATYIRDGGYYIIGDELVFQGKQYSTSPSFIERKWPWSINIDDVQDLDEAANVPRDMIADDPNESDLSNES